MAVAAWMAAIALVVMALLGVAAMVMIWRVVRAIEHTSTLLGQLVSHLSQVLEGVDGLLTSVRSTSEALHGRLDEMRKVTEGLKAVVDSIRFILYVVERRIGPPLLSLAALVRGLTELFRITTQARGKESAQHER